MNPVVQITGAAHGGFGVGRIDGRVLFVPYALPGDTVRVTIERESKGVLWGRIEEVVDPSPDRVDAQCPYFGTCGGCTWLHFAYPAQAEWKRRIVRDCLQRIAGMGVTVGWTEDDGLRLGYRTRAEFQGDGTRRGFHALGTHQIVDVDRCPLCHDKLNAALARLRTVAYKGPVEIVVNPDGDEVLVWTKRRHRKLKNAFPLAGTPGDKGRRASFLFDGVPVVNGAFSQSSLLLNVLLVRTVHDLIGAPGSVLDLYCGTGNLSLGLAVERVLGLDQNPAAVRAATRAVRAGAAGSARAEYRRGRDSAFAQALRTEHWDAVILDPPRTGAKAIAPALGNADADAIVYVSCDPATLARDVKTLAQSGWHIARTTVLDLFPHTPHVETVCRLVRG
jgi:23S rRNA (uracil1939-C5)-methyltransferase